MTDETIISASPAMRHAIATIDRFARTPISVLLVGPTGTGKELLATRLHRVSGRSGRLVDVNCAALPRELAEAELFGHRKGAYTHAYFDAVGLIAAADHGTLFLDELGSLPLELQPKLLRVLERKEVRRVGDTTARPVAFRLVAACQDDVDSALSAGAFREDLFHRVAEIRVDIPPLVERREDVLALGCHFAESHRVRLTPDAGAVLLAYRWPGNVRELRAAILRAATIADVGEISGDVMTRAIQFGAIVSKSLPARPRSGGPEAQRDWLVQVCRTYGWDGCRVSAALGIHRATLFRWLKASGVSLRAGHQFSIPTR